MELGLEARFNELMDVVPIIYKELQRQHMTGMYLILRHEHALILHVNGNITPEIMRIFTTPSLNYQASMGYYKKLKSHKYDGVIGVKNMDSILEHVGFIRREDIKGIVLSKENTATNALERQTFVYY